MTNEILARRIQQRDKHPDELTGAEKKNLYVHRRGALKLWERSLLGDVPLLHDVLRHGLVASKDCGELMSLYLQLRNTVHYVGATFRELRRAEAVRARKTLRKARSVITSKQSPDFDEAVLLLGLHSGELQKNAIQREYAYGYGEGVTHVSMERVTMYRVPCNHLETYFGR